MHFAYRRDSFQSSLSCIKSEGKSKGRSTQKKTASNKSANEDEETKVNQSIYSRGRSPPKNSSSDRSWKEDEEKKSNRSIDGESVGSSTRKDIIALFRRIQSSISQGKSSSSNKRNSKNTKHRQSAESVLDVLHDQFPSKKQVTDKGPNQEGNKPLPQRTVVPKKETKTKGDSTRKGFKVLRPTSNFVKRSPIPSPSTPKEKIDEVLEEGSPSAVVVKAIELQRVDKLKLVELKELAKSRGVKGYSKLKKAELVELLKGLLQR